ncbi:MAG: hypothetical protein JW793_03130, partial [Acidobacteria bacterium]|nr:hypothetical protein [Acidobacteriota bacterium]
MDEANHENGKINSFYKIPVKKHASRDLIKMRLFRHKILLDSTERNHGDFYEKPRMQRKAPTGRIAAGTRRPGIAPSLGQGRFPIGSAG